jgi:hypothetical protein
MPNLEHMSRDELWQWWVEVLTEGERAELMATFRGPLRPDLALELWRRSGFVRVVEPEEWSVRTNPMTWRLTEEVRTFVAQRALEQSQAH